MKSLPDSAQTAQTILASPCRFALSEVAYYSNLVCQKVNIDSTIDLGPRQVPCANFVCLAKNKDQDFHQFSSFWLCFAFP